VSDFDWTMLDLAEGTALREVCDEPARLVRGLFRVADDVYAMTNVHVFGGTDENPGLGGFLWAQTEAAAVRVYDNLAAGARPAPSVVGPFPPPDVLGFADTTYRGIAEYERSRGDIEVKVGWSIPDGHFTSTRLVATGRTYAFGAPDPADTDEPMAVRFDLRFDLRYADAA
jgi:hypothetical protein